MIAVPEKAVFLDPQKLVRVQKELSKVAMQIHFFNRASNLMGLTLVAGFLASFIYYQFEVNKHQSRMNLPLDGRESVVVVVICFLIFFPLFWIVLLYPMPRFLSKKFVSRHFEDLFDPRFSLQLLSIICSDSSSSATYADYNKKLMLAMVPGLAVLIETEYSGFNKTYRRALNNLLAVSENSEELQSLTSALLKASPLFGDRQTLRKVRSLSKNSHINAVLEEARSVLPRLEARIQQLGQSEKQELLTPSSAPKDKDLLLIPHSVQDSTECGELLRPSASELPEAGAPRLNLAKYQINDEAETPQKQMR